jgi:hypothetical protein
MAECNWCDRNEYPALGYKARDNAGFASLFALFGPIGALVALFTSNFNQHGWELWNKKGVPNDGSNR